MRSIHYTNLSIDEEDDSFAAYASFDITSQSSNGDSDDDCSDATPTAAHSVRFSPDIEYVAAVYSPPPTPAAARAAHPTLQETTMGFKGTRNNESYGLLSNAQRKAVAFSLLDDDDDDDFIEKGNEDGGCENTKGACEFVFSPLVHFLQFYMC